MLSLQSIISLLNAASGVLGGCTKSTYCFEQVMGARAVSFYIGLGFVHKMKQISNKN